MKILLLDNYDSFTYNLLHLLEQFDGIDVTVIRNDAISVDEAAGFDGFVLSPGPGLPSEAGILKQLIKAYADRKPMLGVCLGMQAIGEVFGARLINIGQVQHGVATRTDVLLPADELFAGMPQSFLAGRYHSWMVDREGLPESLKVTAVDEQQRIMALRHVFLPVCGVQYHPESILTEYGKQLISNWLRSSFRTNF